MTHIISTNNIRNSIDFDLITQSVSRNKIFWSKVQVISFIQFVTILFNTLVGGTISVAISNNVGEYTTIYLINFFGEILISAFFIFLFLFLSYRMSNITSIITNFLVVCVIPGLSLVSHLILPVSNSMEYSSSQKYQYQNINILDSNRNITNEYVAIKTNYAIRDYSQNLSSNFSSSITQLSFWSNINIADWFFSPFYVIGKDHLNFKDDYNKINSLNKNGYSGSLVRFALDEQRLNSESYSNDYISNNNFGDINIFKLSQDELKQEIFNSLDYLSRLNSVVSLNDSAQLNSLTSIVKNNQIWNQNLFSSNELNTILSLYGYNEGTNLFHYLYKNKEFVRDQIPNIFDFISQKYNSFLSDLINYLYFDNNAIWNIDTFQGVLTSQEMREKYTDIKTKNQLAAPVVSDLQFVKNTYVKHDGSGFKILSQNYTYTDIDLTRVDSSITSQTDWENYVDKLISLTDLDNLVNTLQQIQPNAYLFYSSANTSDINSYDFFGLPKNETWFTFSTVIFGLYIPSLFIVCPLFWKFSVSKNFY
ncbi:hypothetical protein D8X55_03385 [Malacoplasma penetrans]|uniref:hypothetical protein n=1 Tax=Malacoplasma penetrans TaxID=28227 RepID=UPI00101181E1|nr:hypothetical protein [Malacoplasma penetrans]RXY96575.1 hypothetical protein D8X55_03385 [Malacoplasma penetrans]